MGLEWGYSLATWQPHNYCFNPKSHLSHEERETWLDGIKSKSCFVGSHCSTSWCGLNQLLFLDFSHLFASTQRKGIICYVLLLSFRLGPVFTQNLSWLRTNIGTFWHEANNMMAALNSSAAGSLRVDCSQLSPHESDFSMLNELFTNTLHDVSHRPTLSFSLKTLVA